MSLTRAWPTDWTTLKPSCGLLIKSPRVPWKIRSCEIVPCHCSTDEYVVTQRPHSRFDDTQKCVPFRWKPIAVSTVRLQTTDESTMPQATNPTQSYCLCHAFVWTRLKQIAYATATKISTTKMGLLSHYLIEQLNAPTPRCWGTLPHI